MEFLLRRERLEIPAGRRILVVSDVHGHGHFLERLLEKAGFGDGDELIILGDIIEKGPDSLGTLRLVMELSRRPNVHAAAGNVDSWQFALIEDEGQEASEALFRCSRMAKSLWGGCLFLDFCREMGIDEPKDERETARAKELVRTHFHRELKFLRGLPSILEAGNFLFVHGGLPKNWEELEGGDATPVLKFDDFLRRGGSFDRCVVVGHWPVCLYRRERADFNPLADMEKNIISIDGGCGLKRDGQLNCLIIPDARSGAGDVTWTYHSGFPVVTALDAQEEKETDISIQYTDSEVELLETCGTKGLIRLRHLSSGRIFDVPEDYLYESNGRLKCDDYCDYHMAVEPGERVELVEENGLGYLIRRNGLSSWYHGRLCPAT